MVIAVRTDKPDAEIYLLQDSKEIDTELWPAGRELADELLPKIEELLKRNKVLLQSISGIIVFTGSGSFTGLRIGTTIANTLAYSITVPVVTSEGENWVEAGLKKLKMSSSRSLVIPTYDNEPNITTPKTKA